jgi:hypothetical protein
VLIALARRNSTGSPRIHVCGGSNVEPARKEEEKILDKNKNKNYLILNIHKKFHSNFKSAPRKALNFYSKKDFCSFR